MADKVFDDFQGNTIRIGGVCYTYTNETTTLATNTTPEEIDGTYASCLECNVDSSSESSSSSFGYSESSSDSSSSSFGYSSSSSDCCLAEVQIMVRCPDIYDIDSSSESSLNQTFFAICKKDADGLRNSPDSSSSESQGEECLNNVFALTGHVPAQYSGGWGAQADVFDLTDFESENPNAEFIFFHTSASAEPCFSGRSAIVETVQITFPDTVSGYCTCEDYYEAIRSSSSSEGYSESSSSGGGGVEPPAAKVCDPVPGTGQDPPPDMIVRITGNNATTGTNETINWCGETWLPTDDGTEFRVCPVTYGRVFPATETISINSVARMSWRYFTTHYTNSTTYSDFDLSMRRNWQNHSPTVVCAASHRLLVNSLYDRKRFCPPTVTVSNDLNKILGPTSIVPVPAPAPTENYIDPTPQFFGSVTQSGVTYTWNKGDNWPA